MSRLGEMGTKNYQARHSLSEIFLQENDMKRTGYVNEVNMMF